ncbi:uncharacterized protein PITG_17855 [Phytophthora infestans T30-4]|uniref:Uncharacterized protein n=1 Tax=Phytophthora infestans (strain T30-4) TaxID=403677 RepID=D0NWV1_PHYIT|nr:uncharacterized protein PITG_17855 [Phytophthora infestans T30-4]EEY67538.1 conserved hypothetical protein [Phytophthora infestans T30-4]|eukprot:XP_002896397.1 conserved hypothetical protein [Phytophthora infestans T30-4]
MVRVVSCRSNRERGVKATPSAWIRADREGQSKQTYQNAVLFVLNNHRFPKWLYSYDSSVTRTQREMTHHLVVYVCQLTGTSSQSGEIDVAVLARHESPGFSLISYRRSGNNGRDAGCEQPAIDADASTKFTAVASDSMEVDAVGWTSAEAPTEEHKQFDKWAFPRPVPGTAEDDISLKDLKRTEADSKKLLKSSQRSENSLLFEWPRIYFYVQCRPTPFNAFCCRHLLSEVGCVNLTVNDDASWLALRSAMSTSTSAPMTLITDGNLHLFRVLPSGTPSMIATTGGWVIGDYTATFSEVGHSLEVNLYSYAEEEAEGAHLTHLTSQETHLTSQESVNVRRVSLSIRLEEKKNEIAAELTRHKMLIALVRGTVYGSSLSLPLNECKNGFNLSERSAVDRAAIWSEVEWTAWWEFKADYIAMARSYS